ncbi:MAG: ADP-ribosylglycohydrolase family protein [Chloroflexi bacterium]|nr:ADP-ribosylglycohydrolase family protein [Chloroflexota bacterium]
MLEQSVFADKAFACLLGGLIGDAMGTPTEGRDYRQIEEAYGWVEEVCCDGTDDTIMKHILAEVLIETGGYAGRDAWAAGWLRRWDAIFGQKVNKFFVSVLHTAHKLRRHTVPRMAALGNMPSSSSAMCIAPVGIVNACNPRQAALQAYALASLIHVHDVGFCQDGASAIAAAVAEAFRPQATTETILDAAMAYIEPLSGQEMLERIEAAQTLAREFPDYRLFRERLYAQAERFFLPIACDSRETVPLALALLQLGDGDPARCIPYGVNLGRDADTIATMVGGIAGAYRGLGAIPDRWQRAFGAETLAEQRALAERLCATALAKVDEERAAGEALKQIAALPRRV